VFIRTFFFSFYFCFFSRSSSANKERKRLRSNFMENTQSDNQCGMNLDTANEWRRVKCVANYGVFVVCIMLFLFTSFLLFSFSFLFSLFSFSFSLSLSLFLFLSFCYAKGDGHILKNSKRELVARSIEGGGLGFRISCTTLSANTAVGIGFCCDACDLF
jgi:hypothetical protein